MVTMNSSVPRGSSRVAAMGLVGEGGQMGVLGCCDLRGVCEEAVVEDYRESVRSMVNTAEDTLGVEGSEGQQYLKKPYF